MRYRTLGRSGLIVSELALGAMLFGETGPRGTPEDEAGRMVRRYLDAGGTFIDTADVYADGRSEEIVGRAIAGVRDEVVVATKVRGRTGAGPNDLGLSRAHVWAGVQASLRRLGSDWIDVLYLHLWDPVTPIDETVSVLEDLVRQGAVRYVGVSNFAGWQAMKTVALAGGSPARPVAAQYQYSLLARDVEDEFDGLCRAEGLGLVPWGPLAGGYLSGKYRPGEPPTEGRVAVTPDVAEEAWSRRATEWTWRVLAEAEAVAGESGASVPQLAIAWLLTRPTVASVLVGARTRSQLDDNLGAADAVLDDEHLHRLTTVSAPPARYPYRMQAAYGARDDVRRVP
jgi:aryl-alcohol dehydrogenase-like predicted oxidoreductase